MYWIGKDEAMKGLKHLRIEPFEARDNAACDLCEQFDSVLTDCDFLARPYIDNGELLYAFLFDADTNRSNALGTLDSIGGGNLLGLNIRFPLKRAVIAINKDVLAKGIDFATSLFLHELAHMKHDKHGRNFNSYYRSLIKAFNENTGRCIPFDIDVGSQDEQEKDDDKV